MAGNLTDMLSAIIPKVPLNCFTQCLQQRKMCSAIPTKACHHQEGLMMSKGWYFVPVVQNFIQLDILSILANLTQNSRNRSCLFVSDFLVFRFIKTLHFGAGQHLLETCK